MSCQVVSHRLLEGDKHQAFRRYRLQPSPSAVALPCKRHGVRRAIYVKDPTNKAGGCVRSHPSTPKSDQPRL
jgi:hypothetical protein